MDTNELIDKIVDGANAGDLLDTGLEDKTLEEYSLEHDNQVDESVDEAIDAYNYDYRTSDIQSSVSRNVAEVRTLLKKCQAEAKPKDANKAKLKTDLEKAYATLLKQLETAENGAMAAVKTLNDYKENLY